MRQHRDRKNRLLPSDPSNRTFVGADGQQSSMDEEQRAELFRFRWSRLGWKTPTGMWVGTIGAEEAAAAETEAASVLLRI